MKAQINVSLPLNVNVYKCGTPDNPEICIFYQDGYLKISGLGYSNLDAYNNFRIHLAEELHAIANKR